MSMMDYDWILPLTVLTITGFCFALTSYVWFFRRVQINTNLVGSTFIIPLMVTAYSFILPKGLPMAYAISMGEIAMTLVIILYSTPLKYRIRLESAIFINLMAGFALCFALSSLGLFPFLYQDLSIYLILSFVLTSTLVILTKGTTEAPLTSGFAFLGVAQLISLFQSNPVAAALVLGFKAYFYLHVVRFLFNTIHEEIMKEVGEARKIQKEFDDTLRKEVKKQVFFMEMSQQKMAKISQTDALTEALNRKGIMDQMEKLVDDRSVKVFSMLIFDIDKFKNINDTLGHPVGDKSLKILSNIARANLRDGDSLGRYGGDEFIILLPNADTETAFKVAERFRQRIQETEDPHFTVSIGVATYPFDGKSNRELLEYADAGLYISKETGRNKVSRKQPPQ